MREQGYWSRSGLTVFGAERASERRSEAPQIRKVCRDADRGDAQRDVEPRQAGRTQREACELLEGRGTRAPVGEIGNRSRSPQDHAAGGAFRLHDAGLGRSDIDQAVLIDRGNEVPDEVDDAVDHRGRGDGDAQRHHHDQRGPWSLRQRAERIADLGHVRVPHAQSPCHVLERASGGFSKDIADVSTLSADAAVRVWDGARSDANRVLIGSAAPRPAGPGSLDGLARRPPGRRRPGRAAPRHR